ncbi:nuclear transport factor 2 family protein [Burkholderia sp. BCC0322]|uniref:nuclear transport factor 2 family protein n=1 Tax=unclassified Burkholderia TaxID=2613784 RepID=UPI00158EBD41|nr:nuclear transport factor 2 family protein [Burkholderia sp. BCC0322]
MATDVRKSVRGQPWTDAFTKDAGTAFEAALAPDVRLIASALVRPIVGRDLVKAVMAGASESYEHLVFTDQAKTDGRTWLEWEARTYSGLELSGVTVLTMNEKGEIDELSIHHRPLPMLLKFSAELGDRLIGKLDRSYFYQPDDSAPVATDGGKGA